MTFFVQNTVARSIKVDGSTIYASYDPREVHGYWLCAACGQVFRRSVNGPSHLHLLERNGLLQTAMIYVFGAHDRGEVSPFASLDVEQVKRSAQSVWPEKLLEES